MDLGFFTMPIHPPHRRPFETLREDYEMAVFADELGFTEGFFGEHITDLAENVTSSLIFIAWVLEQTKKIKLGTGTVNIPNHHPARIAAEVAMVDHMAKGRFLFGVSPGGLMSDAEVFGNLDRDRTAMFLEGINLILKILRDFAISLSMNFFGANEAVCSEKLIRSACHGFGKILSPTNNLLAKEKL